MNADILLDFSDTTTGLLNDTKLLQCFEYATISGYTNPEWFSFTHDFTRTYVVDMVWPPYPFDVTINGVTSRPQGTKAMHYPLNNTDPVDQARLIFHGGIGAVPPIKSMVKCGYLKVRTGTLPVSPVNIDTYQIYGRFSVLQFNFHPTTGASPYTHAQRDNGSSTNGGFITSWTADSEHMVFWQQVRDMVNGICKTAFWDGTTGEQIGSTSIVNDFGTDQQSEQDFFPYNGYLGSCDADMYWGPTSYFYGLTDFIPLDVGGVINATTINATTLTVG